MWVSGRRKDQRWPFLASKYLWVASAELSRAAAGKATFRGVPVEPLVATTSAISVGALNSGQGLLGDRIVIGGPVPSSALLSAVKMSASGAALEMTDTGRLRGLTDVGYPP
jgi:hypothetical protein